MELFYVCNKLIKILIQKFNHVVCQTVIIYQGPATFY